MNVSFFRFMAVSSDSGVNVYDYSLECVYRPKKKKEERKKEIKEKKTAEQFLPSNAFC